MILDYYLECYKVYPICTIPFLNINGSRLKRQYKLILIVFVNKWYILVV